jgi:hypothetical protein
MATAYATPGVHFEPLDRAPAPIAALRTDVAGFVGVAERGPVDTPVRVESWEQFESGFGGFLATSFLAYAVKGFFDNRGRTCYVVRVAADTVETTSLGVQASRAATAVRAVAGFAPGAIATIAQRRTTMTTSDPQPANRASSIVDDAGGFPVGASVTVRQAGREDAQPIVRAVDNAAHVLVWDEPLPGTFDLAATIAFETTNRRKHVIASVDEALATIQWLAPLEDFYAVGAGAPLLRLATGAAAAVATSAALSVEAASPGSWGDLVEVRLRSGDHDRLSLSVYEEGRIVELYARLERNELLQLSSPRVRVTAVNVVPGAFVRETLQLSGGRDGIAAVGFEELAGSFSGTRRRGLATLEAVDVSLVSIPDLHIPARVAVETQPPPPPPEPDPCLPASALPTPRARPRPAAAVESAPALSSADVLELQAELVSHCERLRDRVALLDPPVAATRGVDALLAWRGRFDTSYAAAYHPWLLVVDPLRLDGNVVRAVPPSGHIAGVVAHTDVSEGVAWPPANAELRWAQGVTIEVDAETHGSLNTAGVNCIRSLPGRGLRVFGERMVSSDPSWRYLNVRRLLLMIEEALEDALQWTVFEGNDVYLRQTVELAVSSFLRTLWDRRALVGATEEEAFFVKCDEETNPPDVIATGGLVAIVGVAAVKPAEFVVFRIGRTEDTLEVSE